MLGCGELQLLSQQQTATLLLSADAVVHGPTSAVLMINTVSMGRVAMARMAALVGPVPWSAQSIAGATLIWAM